MSKSLGNTLHDSRRRRARAIRPSAVRYLLLSAHYRKQLNFTWASLAQAEEALRRLTDFLARLDAVTRDGAHPEVAARVDGGAHGVRRGDARRPEHRRRRSARCSSWCARSTRRSTPASSARATSPAIRDAFDDFDRVLGVLSLRRAEDEQPPVPVDEIERLIEERHAARRRRDFAAADRIRDELAARGVLLEDSAGGTRWKRK